MANKYLKTWAVAAFAVLGYTIITPFVSGFMPQLGNVLFSGLSIANTVGISLGVFVGEMVTSKYM